MITQVVFDPSAVAGNDGWIQVPGGTQPPNRTLPAPIFNDGLYYTPHNNGVLGTWIIRKTVVSDVAGPGALSLTPGSAPPFPFTQTGEGLYIDDRLVAIRVNGVTIPFTWSVQGSNGYGVAPPQSQPVTWLAGDNVIEIEVNNAVQTDTWIAGRIVAAGAPAEQVSGLGVPCDCCPTGPPQCSLGSLPFDAVAETVPQAGWTPVNLAATSDGVHSTFNLSGYNTAGGNVQSTTLRVEYTLTTPQDRVRGLRLWNQAGSDWGDADGLNNFTAEFYAGATLLATQSWQGVNGGQAQTFTLPLGGELNGVDRVVLRNLDKQIGGTIAPLWRELQLLTSQTVFPCRRRNGVLEWYDQAGNLLSNVDVVPCQPPAPAPIVASTLTMTTSAFGDDPFGTAENMCNVVPVPNTATGWNLTGACYDPVVGNPSFTWNNVSSVEMSYGDSGNGEPSGAAFLIFSANGTTIQWAQNLANMVVGEQRLSLVFSGGRRARLTYLSGPPGNSPSGTIRMNGVSTIAVHPLNVGTVPPIRFRLELTNA